ncbi:MAG: M28 family peptidase [Pyrinomonadaceae bacterium]|nr:M28 family peptidase [Pyrinomonadaceae bacterium]
MNFIQQPARRWQASIAALLISFLLLGQAFAQTAVPAKLSATETQLAEKISVDTIKAITAALSAEDMQGRGTMQPGGDKAANYIADRFAKLGLKPLGDKGSYLQKIEFKETVTTPETMFKVGEETLTHGTDYAVAPHHNGNKDVSGEMVFIAYGIQAKSIGRDDLDGVNVKGKVVVMLEGPPANISKEDWKMAEATRNIMVMLVRNGAAAIVYIGHGREEHGPEETIQYLSRRQITLPDEKGYPEFVPPFIYVGSKAAEKLFAKSGVTLRDALVRAEQNNFKPIELNQKAKLVAKYKTAKGAGSNVVGYLEGSDANLKAEAVLFSAHYDAYGTENGKVYPGAADNALGVAEILAIAEAYSKMETKPKRSMVFLAVTGEEYGLYGSKYWAKNPTWKIKQVAANLNLDGVGTEVYAPVKTFVGFGAEHSTLGAILGDVSSAFEIKVIPDPIPDQKIFYRSDHYSFVEKGVPALMLLGVPAGDPQVWIKRVKEWEKTDYHNPGDVIKSDWDWSGARTVAVVMGIMGWRISEMEKMPEWLPSSRFAKYERGNTKEIPEEK